MLPTLAWLPTGAERSSTASRRGEQATLVRPAQLLCYTLSGNASNDAFSCCRLVHLQRGDVAPRMSDAFLTVPAAAESRLTSPVSRASRSDDSLQDTRIESVTPASSSVSGTASDAPQTPAEAPGTPAGRNSPSPRRRQSSSPSPPSSLVGTMSPGGQQPSAPAERSPVASPQTLQVSPCRHERLTHPALGTYHILSHMSLARPAGATRLRAAPSPGGHGRLRRVLRLVIRWAAGKAAGRAVVACSHASRRRGPGRGGSSLVRQ